MAVIRAEEIRAPQFLQSLAQGTFAPAGKAARSDLVFNEIRSLLEQTIQAHVPQKKVEPLHTLSMTGRALFFRFLLDRGIVREKDADDIEAVCPCLKRRAEPTLKDAFANAEAAAQTSNWLDETFNGDFLPLIADDTPADKRLGEYRKFYRAIDEASSSSVFRHLEAILKGLKAVGGGFQGELSLDWNELNFAHVPVGVLSQVYEHFSHLVDSENARATSVHYTPRLVAELMVHQVFGAAAEEIRPAARVLDGACGAGVFLVLAFRRLVQEQWRADGSRPDTDAIQRILYHQLRGFDVSEPALRLAALSLYITAIELNATQRPPKALRFPKNLRERVLFNVALPDDADAEELPLGSLGSRVPKDCEGWADIVIGNPPWTRHREAAPRNRTRRSGKKAQTDLINAAYTGIGRRVLVGRGLAELAAAYENPDNNPDLPFLWRAVEWAKEDGLIAYAMPGRVFAQSKGKGLDAWRGLLASMSVSAIISGADLRKTEVWGGMDIPFCLIFARNRRPADKHGFHFVAPIHDLEPNGLGRFRLDYEATQPISAERVARQPWVLKTLMFGTWRDVEIVEAILAAFPQTLGEVWAKWDETGDKTGQGYNLSPGLLQKDAPFLGPLLDFKRPDQGFEIPYDELDTFRHNHGRSSAHMPRTAALYQPPLVIVPKAPGEDRSTPRAYLADRALTFSQSFYGYSCADHPQAATLAALVYLLPHSELFSYHCAMTSWCVGFDRQMFIKDDLDSVPFPDVAALPTETKTAIRQLARRFERESGRPLAELDDFVYRLYGIDAQARAVIRDTLFSAAIYRRQGRAALARTTVASRAPFREALRNQLAPFFTVTRQQIEVSEPATQPAEWEQPWHFVTIQLAGESMPMNTALLRVAMEQADRTGSSRIIVRVPHGRGLLLGLLNQQRWWTPTRARLCGRELVRRHLDAFGAASAA